MGATSPLYTVGPPGPVVLERGREQRSSVSVERDGAVVSVASATYSLRGGTEAVTATPDIVSGAAEVTLGATALDDLAYGEGYWEEWTLTLDDADDSVRRFRRIVVVGRFALSPPVAQGDIISRRYPDLEANLGGYVASLQAIMDGAWDEVVRQLWRYGLPSTVIVEPGDVYDWYEHAALARVFAACLSAQESDRWRLLYEEHKAAAAAAKQGLRVRVVDPGSDGTISAQPGGAVGPGAFVANRVGFSRGRMW